MNQNRPAFYFDTNSPHVFTKLHLCGLFKRKTLQTVVEHPTSREGQYAFDRDTVPFSPRGADVDLTLCFDLAALRRE